MTPDNKALIEEARKACTALYLEVPKAVADDVNLKVMNLAEALEASEAREHRAVAAVALADSENPVVQALQAQLQQTQARLEAVHQWAEMNPYSGVHDAPLEVRQALAYKGTGAKILKDRLRRASLQDNKEPEEPNDR